MLPILIGTSGYDHPELKGSFYPANLPRKDFLEYYSSVFNALEINSTFYAMPTAERLLNFYTRSKGQLKFSIKLNRLLTHQVNNQWKYHAEEFKKALIPLHETSSLASVLIQFPESFDYKTENRIYLSDLLKNLKDFPCVVEFRHKSWIRASVFQGLEHRKTGIVFCDMPQCASPFQDFFHYDEFSCPFTTGQTYIRMHGRNENAWYAKSEPGEETQRYNYEYSLQELISFIPIIKEAQSQGQQIQLYFNNHPKGIGFNNAQQLMSLLQMTKKHTKQAELDF